MKKEISNVPLLHGVDNKGFLIDVDIVDLWRYCSETKRIFMKELLERNNNPDEIVRNLKEIVQNSGVKPPKFTLIRVVYPDVERK